MRGRGVDVCGAHFFRYIYIYTHIDAASAIRPHLLLLLRLQSAARFQEPLKTLGRLGARLSLIGFTHYSYLARRGGPSSQRGS